MNIDKQKLEQNQAKNDYAQKQLDDELRQVQENEGEYIEPDEEADSQKPTPIEKLDEGDDEEVIPEVKPDEIIPEKDEKPEPKTERPEKYIPLPKYKEEKEGWRTKEEELKKNLDDANKKIEELTALHDSKATDKQKSERLQKLAEKWDTPIEFLEELQETIKEGDKIKPETIVEQKQTVERPVELKPKSQEEIVESFNKEFEGFIPNLKNTYPDVTEQQLKDAQKLMDEYAHSKDFANYPLEHIMKINKKDFDDILGEIKDNPGVEGSKPGGSTFKEVKASEFKPDATGYIDFSKIHGMPEGDKKSKIIDDLSPEIWDKYVQDLASNAGIKVIDNGRVIQLK